MKRFAACLVLTALALVAQPLADKPLTACFAPDTLAVLRIDTKQLMDQTLYLEFLAAKAGGGQTFPEKVLQATGIDLNTVSEVWIGLRGRQQLVVVLKGSFDPATVEARVRNIETIQVLPTPGVALAVIINQKNNPERSNEAVLLDKETLVFGKPQLVDGFLTALLGDGPGLSAAQAAQVAALHESKALLAATILGLPPGMEQQKPWVALFTSAAGQATLGKQDVVIDVALGLAKPEMIEPATKLIEGFRDLYGMMDDNLRRLGPLPTTLLESVTVEPDEKQLLLQVALPRDLVEQLLRQRFGLQ